MRHLTLEALARLADEAPTPAEAEHLAACADCRRERDALRAQSFALARLPDPEPPASAWPALAERLRADGRMRAARRDRGGGGLPRLAAAIAIFLFGGMTGFAARDAADSTPADRAPAVAATDVAPTAITSPEDAARALGTAEDAYLAALERYAELTDAEIDLDDPVARLAALQGIVLTTREALRRAPADPVINGYHLTAVAQRDAMLQQLSFESADPWF